MSSITPVLTVRGAAEAVAFYHRAFGAEEVHRNTYPDGRIVAELAVGGARFRVADEAPEAANLTGTGFFPRLIAEPFKHGLAIVFLAALAMSLVAAAASWLRGGRYVHEELDASAATPRRTSPAWPASASSRTCSGSTWTRSGPS